MKSKLPAFDVLVDMARNDPQRLESLRTVLTDEVIEGATSQRQRRRLQGLQFRVDVERQRARSPISACIKISEMMCHSLAELHKSMVTPFVDERSTNRQNATMLSFPDRTDSKTTAANPFDDQDG
jgi:hypothetical protein